MDTKMEIKSDKTLEFPTPVIKSRSYDAEILKKSLSIGLHPVLARIVAARPLSDKFSLQEALSPRLNQLSSPQEMIGMAHAAERVANAILNNEVIGLETDHDCDGQTSHAVLFHNLVNRFRHPQDKVRSYIGHRLTEGYGLSNAVADRILNDDPRPSLVITADNGSSDEPRIARLKAAGIDVIVTDHHEIPIEGFPKSAYACLNPSRTDCNYGDPYIAGCMVAWLLMAATRQKLIEVQYLPTTEASLADSLDFVAVGTVADCVSIARSPNNRAVVSSGLRLINSGSRPCWRVLKSIIPGLIRSEDLGFRIGPLLNSDGRLASAFGSVTFLLAETDEEANEWLKTLQLQNENRKTIQRDIVKQAIEVAKQKIQACFSLSIYLADGHPGVQGIAASRIKELFGRPTAIFAPKHGTSDLITGSVRGIEQFHVRNALQHVADHDPTLLIAFGGHKGAGGLTLKLNDFDRFTELFEQATKHQLYAYWPLEPVIWTDGPLSPSELNIEFLDSLACLEPYGREFELPIFELEGLIKDLRPVGDGTHARVTLEINNRSYIGIWFSARPTGTHPFPVKVNQNVQCAFTLRENIFRGKRTADIQIVNMVVQPGFKT